MRCLPGENARPNFAHRLLGHGTRVILGCPVILGPQRGLRIAAQRRRFRRAMYRDRIRHLLLTDELPHAGVPSVFLGPGWGGACAILSTGLTGGRSQTGVLRRLCPDFLGHVRSQMLQK